MEQQLKESMWSFHERDAINNNLSPLLFHIVHGQNIRISHDRTVARRTGSYCKGITFSCRPVKVNEKVCIRFTKIANHWSTFIRFGLTYNNPSTFNRYGLPKHACLELTNQPGYWMKTLPEIFCTQNTVLFYYVTAVGDVYYGINGEDKGMLFGNVEMGKPLWTIIDVYGKSTEIELLNNNVLNSCDNTAEESDRIVNSMQGLKINQGSLQPRRYQLSGMNILNFHPVVLHHTKGRNVKFNCDSTIAWRTDAKFSQGYVFTSRPVNSGELFIIQVMCSESKSQSYLNLGLTSCDPANLQSDDLPDDSNYLLLRQEYWVIKEKFAKHLMRNDEISSYISSDGIVQMSKNGDTPLVFHIDPTLKLWAFFVIYGSTQHIRVFSSQQFLDSNEERQLFTPTTSPSYHNVLNLQTASTDQHRSHDQSFQSISSHSSHASNRCSYLMRTPRGYERLPDHAYCMICYDNPKDTVLFMCGHILMCFDCIMQQWRSKGDGHCPLCKAIIRDNSH